MIRTKYLSLIVFGFFLSLRTLSFAQEASVYGVLKNIDGIPVEGFSVEYKNTGTISDSIGNYRI